ncbi:MAG: hypothetical protein ABIB93_06700 [Chloroflexota bacterium]
MIPMGYTYFMFEELQKYNIGIVEHGKPLTFPRGFGAIQRGAQMLDYIYSDEEADYRKSKFTRERFHAGKVSLREFDELKIRFLTRMTSYIIIVCTLDGILKKSYLHFACILKHLECHMNQTPTDNEKTLLNQRKTEIENYLFYRHKVFAHTTFDSPRKNDSLSLQLSSLEYFSGTLFYMKKDYLALGGGSIIVDKEINPPELSIVKGHEHLRVHYSLWEHMFTDVLMNIPREELISKIGYHQ